MTLVRQTKTLCLAFLPLVALAGCGSPQAVRGEQVAGLDDEAMSTGLDKRDLQKMLQENMKALQASAVIQRWQKENRPTLAVMPLRNETSEHVDAALESLLSDIETTLVNAGHVQVVSLERQPQLIEEVRRQYSDAFDPQAVARWGKQIGAKYFITGKVFSADERQDEERRVQYFLFLQVIDAETGAIQFQHKSSLTKAIVK
ncbi:MAG: penicillin-binding protein activator LpoB [Myxococcales bacterium]|nr:penicillin-binding protein activator LpoB [Myxococcales bacterium]